MLGAEPKRQILITGGRGEVGDRGPWSPLTSRRSAVRRDRAGEERAQHLDGLSFSDQLTAQTQKTHLEPRWQLLGHLLTPKPEPRVPQPDGAPSSGHLSGGLGTPAHSKARDGWGQPATGETTHSSPRLLETQPLTHGHTQAPRMCRPLHTVGWGCAK